MNHVAWTATPSLDEPVVVAAFAGWNDAGDAATTAARWLAAHCDAQPVATVDPEEFFDFTSTRPQVRLDDEGRRQIVWPQTELLAGRAPGGGDVVFVIGTEPQLRWRTFTGAIIDAIGRFDPRLVVTLGALLAEVPHTRPVPVVGTAHDPALVAALDLRQSRYEGPTGIVGVLQHACFAHGLPSASLWAAVPTYVPSAMSPKAALALVERCASLLGVALPTTELEVAAAAYERQINELVDSDEETAEYVSGLESTADDDPDDDIDDDARLDEAPGAFIEEVERFLREQGT